MDRTSTSIKSYLGMIFEEVTALDSSRLIEPTEEVKSGEKVIVEELSLDAKKLYTLNRMYDRAQQHAIIDREWALAETMSRMCLVYWSLFLMLAVEEAGGIGKDVKLEVRRGWSLVEVSPSTGFSLFRKMLEEGE